MSKFNTCANKRSRNFISAQRLSRNAMYRRMPESTPVSTPSPPIINAHRNNGPFFSIPSLMAYFVICGTATLNDAHKIPTNAPSSKLRRCILSAARNNLQPSLRCDSSNSSRVATSVSDSMDVMVIPVNQPALGESASTDFQ